jgi:hypothetical protein
MRSLPLFKHLSSGTLSLLTAPFPPRRDVKAQPRASIRQALESGRSFARELQVMKTTPKFCTVVALAGLLVSATARAQTSGLIFSQPVDNQSTFGPSQLWAPSGTNSEVADDFNVIGNIDRLVANGFVWGTWQCEGVYVRFYAYNADGTPGALQQEYFVTAGANQGAVDVTLSPAFAATGRHFVSVQQVSNYWYWWSANSNQPRGQSYFFRNVAAGENWRHSDSLNSNPNADVSFSLYGTVTGAGTVERLSATTLPRSGFLEVFGSNFGTDGQVLIGGIVAPVSSWSSTRVVAYVPETAPLASLPVQVVTPAGSSNAMPLTVTARPPADGRVNWRFRMDGAYSMVSPAIGPDRTIYAVDVFDHLYALAPDGGLKWVVRGAGSKGVGVGADGTIYTATENDIKAFNADGSRKWTFVQNPRAFVCIGVSVGPDGNIYSVGTQGMGVFSLTTGGQLRWAVPEPYSRPIVDYADIVFGPNGSDHQLYFGANNHTRALRLDGTPVFTLGGAFRPAIGPDGSVHSPFAAYTPNGSAIWNFVSPYPMNTRSAPAVGSDGTHYVVQNLIQLFALSPSGTQRWHVTLSNNMDYPVVDPTNTLVVMGGSNTLNMPGSIKAVSTSSGRDVWTVTLPAEDPTVYNSGAGTYGWNQFTSARGVFTPDGSTVYYNTATATGDNNTSRSFIYSIATGSASTPPGPSPSPTPNPSASLRSTDIALSGKLAKNSVTASGVVTVKNTTGATIQGVTVNATWRLPDGSSQARTATTNNRGEASFSTTGTRGTYSLTVTNLAKTGYTFDSANSVLTRSITK